MYDYFPFRPKNITPRLADFIMNKYPDIDFLDKEAMVQAGRDYVFGPALSLIKEEFQEAFILSFFDRYLMNQIGCETFALWKFQLNGTVRAKADVINQLLSQSPESVFTTLTINDDNTERTLTANENGTRNTNGNDTGHVSDTGNTYRDETESKNYNENLTNEKSDKQTTDNTESADDTLISNKKSRGETSGTTHGTEQGTTEEHDTSNEDNTGTVGNEETGNDVKDTTADKTSHGVRKFSDTPQNGLEPIEDGTYLTSATIDDTTGKDTTKDTTTSSKNGTRTDDLHKTGKADNNGSSSTESNGTTSGTSDVTDNGTDTKNHEGTSKSTVATEGGYTDTKTGKDDNTVSAHDASDNQREQTGEHSEEELNTSNRNDHETIERGNKVRFLDFEKLMAVSKVSLIDVIMDMFIELFILYT